MASWPTSGALSQEQDYSCIVFVQIYNRCNPAGPPQVDVESKNAAAVQTVQSAGVTRIVDRYAVITGFCGTLYNNCTW